MKRTREHNDENQERTCPCVSKMNPSKKEKINLHSELQFENTIIEINDTDDNDLELLYSRYPSTEYEISLIENVIKQEDQKDVAPKTYKITINMRDPRQQTIFRASLLEHYKQCIISGKQNPKLLDAAHIMPFKQVGSSLETGILLRKELHYLWDKYDLSIDPHSWTVHLSKDFQADDDYSKYHLQPLSNETILLLQSANFHLLVQHYGKFNDKMNGIKTIVPRSIKPKKPKKPIEVVDSRKILKHLISKSLNMETSDPLTDKESNIAKLVQLILPMLCLENARDNREVKLENIKKKLKESMTNSEIKKEIDELRKIIPELRNIDKKQTRKDQGEKKSFLFEGDFVRISINLILKLAGLRLGISGGKNLGKFKLLWTAHIDANLSFLEVGKENKNEWQNIPKQFV